MNAGTRRLVRLLAEQLVREAYDGEPADGDLATFSTPGGEETLTAEASPTEEAANDDREP